MFWRTLFLSASVASHAQVYAWNVSTAVDPLSINSFAHPVIICDAGSTGSRVYAFHVPVEDDSLSREPKVELLGRAEVGMSELAQMGLYHNASETIIPYLLKGLIRLGPNVPIYIFATGGVRLLESSTQTELWNILRMDIEAALANKHSGELSLMALNGVDEALYGLLSANFLLSEHVSAGESGPGVSAIGVLDLGGSSLEISLVGPDLQAGTHDDILVSFKSLGLQRFRKKVEEADDARSCNFETGNGELCRQNIRRALLGDEEFLPRLREIAIDNRSKFVGISAFAYAMDFAHWILKLKLPGALSTFVEEFPNPRVTSLRSACDAICSLPHLDALFRQHRFTSTREAPGRCFDVCFIAELLGIILDDRMDERSVFFLFESKGTDLEWTLGYYLKHHLPGTRTSPGSSKTGTGGSGEHGDEL